MRIQQEEREASRTRGEDGEGPETAYSPSLSTATAPFRRELAEDEEGTAARRERSSEAEDEQTEQEELDEAKNGLGISMQVNGLGLDMADISGSPPSAPSEHKHRDGDLTPMTLEQALETGLTSSAVSQRRDSFTRFSRPASPSVLNSSTSSGIRQSPAVPPFNRSISRLSLSIPDGLRPQFSHLISGSDSLEHHQQLPYDLPHEAPRDIPLSDSALLHIRKMIHQALAREEVPNSKAWEPVLERLLLELTEGPVPDIKNGDAMDVRRYVRIKKLPGGRPKDSEFIDGVIFTKNLLHKKMPRSIEQPRIAVVTFRVELERPGPHYLQLEKHISQEDGHLQNMAKRLADVRPHLILFSENVPRLALESLADRGIAVAKHVKPEAIAAVSRATRATVIDSLDILATQPELGRCKNFRVQTFAHEEIPEGRKTFLRFEGCKRELGCTILLRGGTMETLMKIKKIVNMLVLVVYNAKLEGYLFWDEHLDIVASPSDSVPAASLDDPPPTSSQHVQPGEDLSATVKLENSKSRLITQSLDPYRSTALSSSSLVRFPPPYPLVRMADEDRHLRELRDTRDADETRKIIEEEAASRAQSISAGSSSTSLSSSHQPSISSVLIDAATLAQGASTQKVLQKPEDVAKMQEVAEAEERYSERLVVWKEYREKNQDSFDPEDHQQLFILESLLHGRPDEPKKVCKPPAVVAVTFYGSEDLTISQYINRIIHEFSQECTSPSCHQPLSEHSRIFVHGDCRIQISIDPHAPPSRDANFPADWIGLQTSCERCNCQSRLVRMSDSTSRLSFHKFLELSFYPSERLVCGDQNCPHDAHLDHVRYWYYSGARIMITMQRIDLRDVVPPPRNVKVKPDTQLLLRNSEYEVVQQRTKAFFDSVQARINAFRLDCVQIQRLDECKAALADFSSRCEADRRTVLRLLVSAYEQSQETNGTEMTGVRRALQEKVVQFEGDWTVFEKRVILSEQDSRRSGKRYSPDSMLSLSPGRRSVSGSLPPSIEVEEESTASSSEAVNSATSSTNDSRHAAESSVDSTSTVRTTSPDLASLSPLALEPPALSINDVSPTSLSPVDEPFPSSVADLGASTSTLKGAGPRLSIPSDNSDMESDSTICADSRYPSISGASSPFIRNQPRRSNETSPAEESEPDEQRPVVRRRKTGQLVSEIIQSFESGSIGRSDSMRSTKTAKSPDRPLLRRGHTDKPRATKIRQPGPFALSDGDNSCKFHSFSSPRLWSLLTL
jgi:1-phosphatidylinositol-3-phosphate 5-kinase